MKRFVVILGVLMLGGCATAYKPEGHGGGYTDARYGPNLFAVTVRANGYTSSDRATELAMLRSAELTLQNGFTHFVIAERAQEAKTSTFSMPTTTYTTGNINTQGNVAYLNAQTTTTGGQTFNISKPRVYYKIECYRGQPDRALGLAYDARAVCESLGSKYGVDCQSLIATNLKPTYSNAGEVRAELSADLPAGWQRQTLSDELAQRGGRLFATNKTIDAGALVSMSKRSEIVDTVVYAKSLRANQASLIDKSEWSELSEITINGRRAWKFWVTGLSKRGMQVQYLGTVIEGESQMIYVNTWTSKKNFDDNRTALESLAGSFSGL